MLGSLSLRVVGLDCCMPFVMTPSITQPFPSFPLGEWPHNNLLIAGGEASESTPQNTGAGLRDMPCSAHSVMGTLAEHCSPYGPHPVEGVSEQPLASSSAPSVANGGAREGALYEQSHFGLPFFCVPDGLADHNHHSCVARFWGRGTSPFV